MNNISQPETIWLDPTFHQTHTLAQHGDTSSKAKIITALGSDVKTFNFIIDSGFGELWDLTPIPCYDTSSSGNPWSGWRSLDVNGALGLALYYLNSMVMELSFQEIFGLIPSMVSQYITFSLEILLKILHCIPGYNGHRIRSSSKTTLIWLLHATHGYMEHSQQLSVWISWYQLLMT